MSKLGRFLTNGGHHFVYQYDEDKVIKIPKLNALNNLYGIFSYKTILKDINLVKHNFQEYLLDTEVLRSNKYKRKYVMVQKYLKNFEFVNQNNFRFVKDQLKEIAERNFKIIKTKKASLDYLGYTGFINTVLATLKYKRHTPDMSNLAVIKQEGKLKVKILDVNLFELRPKILNEIGVFRWMIDYAGYFISKHLIWLHFRLRV